MMTLFRSLSGHLASQDDVDSQKKTKGFVSADRVYDWTIQVNFRDRLVIWHAIGLVLLWPHSGSLFRLCGDSRSISIAQSIAN